MENEQEKILSRAERYCAAAERCESDVREKIRQWGASLSADEEDEVIARLYDGAYIDQERYAAAFVRDKFRFNHWGRIKIETMLRSKRIDKAVISRVIAAEIDEEAYIRVLTDLVGRKLEVMVGCSEVERRSKVFRFAASRGFEAGAVYAAYEAVLAGRR